MLARPIGTNGDKVMNIKLMTLAMLALVLSPSLATAAGPTKNQTNPTKTVQSNGTRQNVNEYHDRTPHVHERGATLPR
jgi:hypothetical protein